MRGRLRIGIAGAGVMGAGHARFITTSVPGTEVTAIADLDRGKLQQLNEELGGSMTLFDTPEQLFSEAEIDAVIIATPDHFHPAHIRLSLERGLPTLCEKPIASNLNDAYGIAEEIRQDELERGQRLIHFGFMRRFDPSYLEVRTLIATGEFGRPLFVRTVTRNVSSPGITTEGLYTNIAVHDFDVLRWLLDSDWRSVQSHYPRASALAPVGLDDPLLFTAEMDNGVLVVADIIANNHYGYDVRTEVVCESGSIEIGIHGDVITRVKRVAGVLRGGTMDENWIPRFTAAYIGELEAWAESVRTGINHPDLATVEDALAASIACAMGVASTRL
jgi:myo-inositol 2-dehydrogenase/D-chiro-inositol 1-dehydrogenase